MSIVARILTLMFVTLMLVATVEVNSGLKLRATREAELQDEAMELARIATLDMDGTLQGARQLLAALAKLPMAADWDAACSVIIATVNNDSMTLNTISSPQWAMTVASFAAAIARRGPLLPTARYWTEF